MDDDLGVAGLGVAAGEVDEGVHGREGGGAYGFSAHMTLLDL